MSLLISYRLAPEFAFPTPIEDCYSATLYFFENLILYPVRVDLNRIIFAGDSAGNFYKYISEFN